MLIDTVVFYQVTDPKLFTYGVENPISAIENLQQLLLRNIIGINLIKISTSRDTINSKMRLELDEATDPWGIKINRVELKGIIPPINKRSNGKKEMKATCKKRSISEAQATKEAANFVAQGEKTVASIKS